MGAAKGGALAPPPLEVWSVWKNEEIWIVILYHYSIFRKVSCSKLLKMVRMSTKAKHITYIEYRPKFSHWKIKVEGKRKPTTRLSSDGVKATVSKWLWNRIKKLSKIVAALVHYSTINRQCLENMLLSKSNKSANSISFLFLLLVLICLVF